MCHHRPSPFCFFTSCPRGRVSSHQPARAPWAERLRASDARRRLVRGWGRDVGDGRRRTRPRGQSLGEAQTHRRARPPTRRRQGRILRRSRLGFETRRLVPRARRRPPVLRLPTRRARPSRGRPRRAGRDPGVEAASRGRSLASRTFVRPRRVRRADRRAVVRAPRAAGRVRRGARGLDSGRAQPIRGRTRRLPRDAARRGRRTSSGRWSSWPRRARGRVRTPTLSCAARRGTAALPRHCRRRRRRRRAARRGSSAEKRTKSPSRVARHASRTWLRVRGARGALPPLAVADADASGADRTSYVARLDPLRRAFAAFLAGLAEPSKTSSPSNNTQSSGMNDDSLGRRLAEVKRRVLDLAEVRGGTVRIASCRDGKLVGRRGVVARVTARAAHVVAFPPFAPETETRSRTRADVCPSRRGKATTFRLGRARFGSGDARRGRGGRGWTSRREPGWGLA